MGLSLRWLMEYAVSKGGYDITPNSRHLQDLKKLLNDMERIRGVGLWNGNLSLGDMYGPFQELAICSCDAKSVTDSDGSSTSVVGCFCDNRCSCNSYIGSCDCESYSTSVWYNNWGCHCYGDDNCSCNLICACNEVCMCNTAVVCSCDDRCSCNSYIGYCDCESRCSCNVQNTCTCDTRCSCNTQRVF